MAVLFERGLLAFGEPLSRVIPDLGGGERAAITIHHLLIHQAGISDTL